MKKCAERITDWLIKNNAISIGDRKIYVYGAYSLLLSVFPIFMTLIFGFWMRCPVRAVLVIVPFVLLRKYSGGFHAQSEWTCLLGSSILLILCIKLSFLMEHTMLLLILSSFAVISLIVFSPIDNQNRILDADEKTHCKKITFAMLMFFSMLIIICLVWKSVWIASCLTTGVLLSAVLQYLCIINRFIKQNNG